MNQPINFEKEIFQLFYTHGEFGKFLKLENDFDKITLFVEYI